MSSDEAPVRVLVADDHSVVRAGLRLLLAAFDDVDVVGEAADGEAAVDQVAITGPDVVLMDLSMPGVDGVEATARIHAAHPGVRVVVLTTFSDRSHVTAAVDAGAVGFLLKDADPGTIHEAIRAAARGEAPLDPRAALALLDRRRGAADALGAEHRGGADTADDSSASSRSAALDDLTPREREVLACVGEGLSNRLIARRLGIAEKTVKTHLTRVFAVIGVSDRTQAALWWSRHSA